MTHTDDLTWRIMPLAPAQLDGVEALEQICFAHPWSRSDLEAQLTNPCAHFFTAVAHGRVIGYLGLYAVCGEGSVANVAVLPEYRRRGVARALFAHALTHCAMDFITLEVRKSNAPALRLYRALGFVQVGERPRFYTEPEEDAALLRLTIPQARAQTGLPEKEKEA